MNENIRIHRQGPGDGDREALVRLAERDSAAPPTGPVLVAEVDGEPMAAVPLDGGPAIADPFHRTAELVALLELRARQMRTPRSRLVGSPRRRRLLRPADLLAALAIFLTVGGGGVALAAIELRGIS